MVPLNDIFVDTVVYGMAHCPWATREWVSSLKGTAEHHVQYPLTLTNLLQTGMPRRRGLGGWLPPLRRSGFVVPVVVVDEEALEYFLHPPHPRVV